MQEDTRGNNNRLKQYINEHYVSKKEMKISINENAFEVETKEYGKIEVMPVVALEELMEEKQCQ